MVDDPELQRVWLAFLANNSDFQHADERSKLNMFHALTAGLREGRFLGRLAAAMERDTNAADTARLDFFAEHCLREASMRFDDGTFKAVNAWTIAAAGKDLRAAIDAMREAAHG